MDVPLLWTLNFLWGVCTCTTEQSYIHAVWSPAIYPAIFWRCFSCTQQGYWSISHQLMFWQRRRCTLGESPVYPWTTEKDEQSFKIHTRTQSHGQFRVCLGCMFLDGWRKWQYSGRICKLRLQTQVSRPQPSYCLTISFGMKNFQVKRDMAMTFSHTQSLIQSGFKTQTSFKWQRVCRWDCHSSSNTPQGFFPDIFLYGQGLPPSLTQLPWTFHNLLAFHRHQGVCNTHKALFSFLLFLKKKYIYISGGGRQKGQSKLEKGFNKSLLQAKSSSQTQKTRFPLCGWGERCNPN